MERTKKKGRRVTKPLVSKKREFKPGMSVAVYSDSKKKYFTDGKIVDICRVPSRLSRSMDVLPAGSIRVCFNKKQCNKWILPHKHAKNIRLLSELPNITATEGAHKIAIPTAVGKALRKKTSALRTMTPQPKQVSSGRSLLKGGSLRTRAQSASMRSKTANSTGGIRRQSLQRRGRTSIRFADHDEVHNFAQGSPPMTGFGMPLKSRSHSTPIGHPRKKRSSRGEKVRASSGRKYPSRSSSVAKRRVRTRGRSKSIELTGRKVAARVRSHSLGHALNLASAYAGPRDGRRIKNRL